jgi:hypothetical protein
MKQSEDTNQPRPRRNWAIGGIGLLVAAVVGSVLVTMGHGEMVRAPGILLVSITENPDKTRVASMQISNCCSLPITFNLGQVQTSTNGHWPDFPLIQSTITLLPPHQCTNVLISLPLSPERWRLPVYWFIPPKLMERAAWLMGRVKIAILNRRASIIFRRPGDVIPGHTEISYSRGYGKETHE